MSTNDKLKKIMIYSGDDRSYWQSVQHRYATKYSHVKFEFLEIFNSDAEKYQDSFLDFLDVKPSIIYIDFSKNLNSQLQLALMLKRISTTKHVPMVGLIDDKKLAKDCWSAGVDFIHVKCGELHDVVYDPYYLAYPKEVSKPDFARARMTQESDLIDDIRVGYIAADYIHAEGNLFLQKGEVVSIETHLPSDIVPSQKFIVKEVKTSDLYYDYKFSYDLEMLFVDKPGVDDAEMEEALKIENAFEREMKVHELQEKANLQMDGYDQEVLNAKKKHKDWVLDHVDISHPKKTKILLVDQKMEVLHGEKKPLDQYPFTIRCQTIMTEDYLELERGRPNIIAMKFTESLDPKEFEELVSDEKAMAMKEKMKTLESEAMEKIKNMIDWIKTVKGYNPFVILFNCDNYTSKAFQDTLKYPLVITYKGEMVLTTILDMAGLFEKKQEANFSQKIKTKIEALKKENIQKYGRLRESDFIEDRYYIRKSNPLSHALYKHNIIIKTMTESEVVFAIDKEIKLCNYRLFFPTEVSVKLIPQDEKPYVKESGKLLYKGLFHATGEHEKKELRRHVNEIFFSGINQERAKEDAAFKEVHDQALLEKEELDNPETESERPLESSEEA